MNKLVKSLAATTVLGLSFFFLVIPGVNAFFAPKPTTPIYVEKNPEYSRALGRVTVADLIQQEYGPKSAYGRGQLTVGYGYACIFEHGGDTVEVQWEERKKGWNELNDEFFAPEHALNDTVSMYFPASAPEQAVPRNLHFEVLTVPQLESERQNAITFGMIGAVLVLLCGGVVVRGFVRKG